MQQVLNIRPPIVADPDMFFPVAKPLVFQILEVRVENCEAPAFDLSNTTGAMDVRSLFNNSLYEAHGTDNAATRRFFNNKGPCIVYVFGINTIGQSLCVAVTGFRPWFFIELTRHVDETFITRFCADLVKEIRTDAVTVDFVQRKKVYGWVPQSTTNVTEVKDFTFARIRVANVSALRAVSSLIEQHNLRLTPDSELSSDDRKKLNDKKPVPSLVSFREKLVVSETKVQASEKFLASHGLTPSSWTQVDVYEEVALQNRVTVSQVEATCSFGEMRHVTINQLAPLLIAAVDIEVQSSDYRSFPEAKNPGDACTFIGTTFWRYGDKHPCLKVMQVLGTCDPVDGILIESYDTEEELLLAWRDLIVVRANPDQIVSYNGTGFDFAYLAARHELLQAERKRNRHIYYSRFYHLGRFLFQAGKLATRDVSSAGMGQNEISEFPMHGRLQMDLFQYVKTSQKLSSYKLDDVCKEFLGDTAHSKVVLDFPGWVEQLATTACDKIRASADQVFALAEAQSPEIFSADAFATQSLPSRSDACKSQSDACKSQSDACKSLRDACKSLRDACLAKCVECLHVCAHHQLRVDMQEKTSHDGVDEGNTGSNTLVDVLDDRDVLGSDDAGGPSGSTAGRIHTHLQDAQHFLGRMVELLNNSQTQHEVQELMYAHVQPALDASGPDNYRKLFRMYECSSAHRAAIALYCQVDCDLVLYLMDRINVLPNMAQMSQVTYTLLNDISSRGQQIKTFNLIARHCFRGDYVMNFCSVGWDATAEYEGATVLEPVLGYYERPVVTLDFASLYPSIMQAYNLCFSSIVLEERYTNLEGAKYGRYDIAGKVWTFQEHHKGLLPQILEFLVNERRACKKEMKRYEKGSLDYKLADGKQLALKVSCNSVYGFTGAMNHGMFPCMPVAVATTYNGRALIQQTKLFMETNYGATVIYGDTDSVMVQFPGVDTVHAAFEIAARAAKHCTSTFRDVLSLEFEKVYCPYLLIRKKHYAGMKYEENPDHAPVLDAKGLALVRRDNCLMVRTTMRQILNATMRDRNPLVAYEIVQAQINKLVERQVDLSELQISNCLRKDLQTDHHPHVQVVKNMVARHSFGVPRVGDRVPYVIVEGAKKSNIYERAEHPKFVQDMGLKIDLEYYLRNQLQQRLEKVLAPLPIPSVTALFDKASREIDRRRMGLRRLDTIFQRIEKQPTSRCRSIVIPVVAAPTRSVQNTLFGHHAVVVADVKKTGKKRGAPTAMPARKITDFLHFSVR